MVKGAIFDMDGTLLDSMAIWQTVALDFFREAGYEPPVDLNDRLRKMTYDQAADYCHNELGVDLTRDEIVNGMLERVSDFYFNRVETKTGVKELLEDMSQRGIRMCLATVTLRPLVEAALKKNDILKYFDAIFTCSEVGHDKNEPYIYRKALEFLGTEKAETVVFEDEVHTIRTAKNDGFRVLGVAENCVPEQDSVRELCDFYISDYAEDHDAILDYMEK